MWTLRERKAAKVAALRNAVTMLRGVLCDYARVQGGRFLLFGSAARGDLRYDSDVDVLLDFPEPATAEAWRFVEDECARLGLTPDIRPIAWCTPDFVAHVLADAVELR